MPTNLNPLRLARSLLGLSCLVAVGCSSPAMVVPDDLSVPVISGAQDMAGVVPDLSLVNVPDLAPLCRIARDCGGGAPGSACCGGACTNTLSDVNNCGACGVACGAGKVCCGGNCADLTSDRFNCGACGTGCTYNNSAASCMASSCAVGACQPGWGDCNLDPKDGCETNLRTDGKNCKKCGAACTTQNGVAGCDDNGCYLKACNFGFDDCNQDPMDGCEASVLSDEKNCGSCGTLCNPMPHGRAGCALAQCQVKTCDQGFADCNGVEKDGCETSIIADANNCGGCGVKCAQGLVCKGGGCTCPNCAIPNASAKCINNVCLFDKCNPGFADCDGQVKNGCEVDTTADPVNCGACGTVCPKNAAVCVNGVCTNSPCLNNPQWTQVTCTTGDWVWSRDRAFQNVQAAAAARVLATGCNHGQPQPALGQGVCSLDGKGWVSTTTFVMAGCNNNWWHLGGRFSGACGGHDGDTWRHLVLTDNDCYAY